ncbi:MAG: hypothetical protein IJS19_07970 [Muribaculaceae bacterium]|nr:hypothetical protein [Muribaculaceae bacterium]
MPGFASHLFCIASAGFYPSVISLRSLTAPLLGGHFRKLDVLRSARTNIEDLASGSLAHIARRAVRDGEAKTVRRNRPCKGSILQASCENPLIAGEVARRAGWVE